MSLVLQIRRQPAAPLEVEGVLPERVRAMSLGEIERLEIFHGNEKTPLAEFFAVVGDPGDERIVWEGDLARVHWVGAKMASGRIEITGPVGRHLGSEMRGGEIIAQASASDWVGGEMHGGFIRVRGDAGHLVGSAYRGSPRGMTGGTILIHGSAGNELGHSMRRGLLAVGGAAGDLAGFGMLAGTIVLCGEVGIRHGAGMKRGTLAFLASRPALLPSFRRACRFRPLACDLIARHLLMHDFPAGAALGSGTFDVYNGDAIEGGRGEVLIAI